MPLSPGCHPREVTAIGMDLWWVGTGHSRGSPVVGRAQRWWSGCLGVPPRPSPRRSAPSRLLGGERLRPLRHLQVRLRPRGRDEHGGVPRPLGRGGLGAAGQVRWGVPAPHDPPPGQGWLPRLGPIPWETPSPPLPLELAKGWGDAGKGAKPPLRGATSPPVPERLSLCPPIRPQGPPERAGGGALASQELLPLLPLQARHVECPQQEATQGLAPRARPAATGPLVPARDRPLPAPGCPRPPPTASVLEGTRTRTADILGRGERGGRRRVVIFFFS